MAMPAVSDRVVLSWVFQGQLPRGDELVGLESG